MFASRTIVGHVARGAVGVGALAGAVALGPSQPLVWLLAIPVAAVAFRGCPMCWTVGLVETVAARVRGRSIEGTCTAGCDSAPAGSHRTLDSSHEGAS